MKALSIMVFRWLPEKGPILLSSAFELSSFGYFQRGSVKEVATFVSREVVSRATEGQRQSVTHQEYVFHAYVSHYRVACAVISDAEYPSRVAFSLITSTLEDFMKLYGSTINNITSDTELSADFLSPLLLKFQNPAEADSVMKIQKDLDDTKEVLVKSIDQLLIRGEKLENLAAKSNDLSFQSKAFLSQSEKLNSCCTLI